VGDIPRRTGHALHTEAFSKQRFRRIGYLGPLDASIIRVVEVGIKKCGRSTASNMTC
jgi:hypothetical protein